MRPWPIERRKEQSSEQIEIDFVLERQLITVRLGDEIQSADHDIRNDQTEANEVKKQQKVSKADQKAFAALANPIAFQRRRRQRCHYERAELIVRQNLLRTKLTLVVVHDSICHLDCIESYWFDRLIRIAASNRIRDDITVGC